MEEVYTCKDAFKADQDAFIQQIMKLQIMTGFSIRSLGAWLAARKWHLIILIVLVGNIILVAKAYKSFRHEMASIHAENQQTQADVKGLQTRFAELTEIPLAYAETPKGLKLVPASQGVSKADIEFLSRYRGPILPEQSKVSVFKPGNLIATLKAEVLSGFNKEKEQILRSVRSERQALIAFAVLRTNGSMPTYEVRPTVPNNLEQIVSGSSGNCSDYTLRLMMILESIGVKASTISSVTKNLGGHVFVDAYDPQEDTSYLLDANFNVMIVQPQSKGRSFIETLLMMNKQVRAEFAKSVSITAFPVYFRFVDPGNTGFERTPLTPEFINEQRADREPMWRRWLSQDMDQLVDWWKKAPNHAPRTLRGFSEFLTAIPGEFNVSTDYASNLRKVAGLEIVKPAGVVKH